MNNWVRKERRKRSYISGKIISEKEILSIAENIQVRIIPNISNGIYFVTNKSWCQSSEEVVVAE